MQKRRKNLTKAKLKSLFDYQHFEENSRLRKVIDDTHRRLEALELTDDDLDLVAAAGVQDEPKSKKPGDKPHDG